MKTKYLIVKVMDTPIPAGQEFSCTSYPSDGLYLTTNGFLVLRQNQAAMSMMAPAPSCWVDVFEGETPAAGVSEDTMLKAIALAQKPELALEMFKCK